MRHFQIYDAISTSLCTFLLSALCFLAVFTPLSIQAQNEQNIKLFTPNDSLGYWEGRIYLKVKPAYNSTPLSMDNWTTNKQWAVLASELQKYDVQEITRPFRMLKTDDWNAVYEIQLGKHPHTEGVIKRLSQLPIIEYVERVPMVKHSYTPNDPQVGNQYNINKIQAFQAWDTHKGGRAVVAIVDDAVLLAHEDLAANIWVNPNEIPNNGIDDDNNGYVDDINGYDIASNDNNPSPDNPTNTSFTHGTHCAGIAGAVSDNGKGIASIGFNNKIMAVKTALIGNGSLPFAYQGVAYAIAAKAHVISMSWGGGGFTQTLQDLFNTANAKGIVCVAAAGNNNYHTKSYPAGYDNVIAVAATDQNDTRAGFSSFGSWIDVTAPGVNILSTLAGGNDQYGNLSGTSMACPLVAGLVGLIRSNNPSFTPFQVENCLKASTDNIDRANANYAGALGVGRINAARALQCGLSLCAATTKPTFSDTTFSGITLNWTAVSGIGYYRVEYKRMADNNWLVKDTTMNLKMVFTGLSNGTYDFRVITICKDGASGGNSIASSYTIGGCAAPIKPTITGYRWNGFNFYCPPVTGAIGYELQSKGINDTAWNVSSRVPSIIGFWEYLPYAPDTLLFRVVAFCSADSRSEPSPVVVVVPVGDSPCGKMNSFNLSNITSQSVKLTWSSTKNTGTPDYHIIKFKLSSESNWPTQGHFLRPTDTSMVLGGLLPNTNYDVLIFLNCTDGTGSKSNPVRSFKTLPIESCTPPTNLTLFNTTATTGRFFWQNAVGISTCRVEFKERNAPNWTNSGLTTSNGFDFKNLIPNATYVARVFSICGTTTESTPSAEFTFTTQTACPAPNTPSVSNVSSNSATVSWNAVTGVSAYVIEYKLSNSPTWLTFSISPQPSLVLTGLLSNKSYDVRVSSFCNGEKRDNSAVVTFTTLANCTPTTQITASNITTTSAMINWAAVAGVGTYQLVYKLSSGVIWMAPPIDNNVTSLLLTNLTPNTAYDVMIYTVCAAGGFSAPSNIFTFTTAGAVCNAPATPTLAIITTSGASIRWSSVPGITSYRIEFKLSSSNIWQSYVPTDTTGGFHMTGVTCASMDVRVSSLCPDGTYLPSPVRTFMSLCPCADANEPNNSTAIATPIGSASTTSGSITSAGDEDFYKFTTTESNTNVAIMLTRLSADFNVQLLDANGVVLASSSATNLDNERIYFNSTMPKTYFVRVFGATANTFGYNCYILQVSSDNKPFACTTPTGTTTTAFEERQNPSNTPPQYPKAAMMDLKLSPNPAFEQVLLNISVSETDKYQIMVYDALGKQVMAFNEHFTEGGNQKTLNLQSLAKGLYLVRLVHGSSALTKKLIVD